MTHIRKNFAVAFFCVFSGISSCSNPEIVDESNETRPVLPPNYILSKYSVENRHILKCRKGVSEIDISKNLDRSLSSEGRHSYFLFELGLCYYVFGDQDSTNLYMYRAATYSKSLDMRQSAKLLALEFLALDSMSNSRESDTLFDALWANNILDSYEQSSNSHYSEFSKIYRLTMHGFGAEYAAEKLDQIER